MEQPSSPHQPRTATSVALAVLGWAVRASMGLAIVFQCLCILVYNLNEYAKSARESLKKQRQAGVKLQLDMDVSEAEKLAWKTYDRLEAVPELRELVDDWISRDVEADIGRFRSALSNGRDFRVLGMDWRWKGTDWWAFTFGQEQAWTLFPDAVDYTCFVSVELRWDDDPEADGPRAKDVPEPVVLTSDNEPPDVSRYFRLGRFRLRRYESNFEVPMRLLNEEREARKSTWEQYATDKVLGTRDRGEREELFLFLRWKMRTWLREHPGTEEPKQVILRSRTWTIPPPPGPKPWDWVFETDEPVVRWRPEKHQPGSDGLEMYLHTIDRFQSKTPTRWPNMPKSSD